MLAKEYRFHGRGAIKYVYRKGTSIRSDHITLKVILGQRHKNFRAAVVVSNKVTKSAPKRNRIRRRIYEIIRKNSEIIKSDADIVFTVFDESVAKIDHEELQATVLDLLKKGDAVVKK